MASTLTPRTRHTRMAASPDANAGRRAKVIDDIDITGASPAEMVRAGEQCMRAGGEVWMVCYPDGRTVVSCSRATDPDTVSTALVTTNAYPLQRLEA